MENSRELEEIKLIALDLDGTLFDPDCKITEGNKIALRKAMAKGVTIVISTGRPYIGMPLADLTELGINYAITVNGAGIYRVPEKECLYEECLDAQMVAEIAKAMQPLHLYFDMFVEGNGIGYGAKQHLIDELAMAESTKTYIKTHRTFVPDCYQYMLDTHAKVQKMTLDFIKAPDGSLIDYDKAQEILQRFDGITVVSGGVNNLEITRAGVTKGKSLSKLAEILGIDQRQTMAIGDSENDIDILKSAHLGIAMANAEEGAKAVADAITGSNTEDGVAMAIYKYIDFEN